MTSGEGAFFTQCDTGYQRNPEYAVFSGTPILYTLSSEKGLRNTLRYLVKQLPHGKPGTVANVVN